MNKSDAKKIILAHHSLIYSSSQALRDYIRKFTHHDLLYISHPLPEVQIDKKERSYSEFSSGLKVSKKERARKRFSLLPLTLMYEVLLTIKWSISQKGKCDVFIGIDNFNALTGLFLKRIGKVRKVVYYTIDYFPQRYPNKMLNSIYHSIDKICVRYSDETWNVSDQMIKARALHNNMKGRAYKRQITVPIGIWFDRAPRKSFNQIEKTKLIFVGHLVSHMGVDLVIRTMPQILKKIPEAKLEIIGGGEELNNLKKMSHDLKLDTSITFHGWIKDRSKLEKIMSTGAVGLATFNTEILDEKVKNADPGKIKDYMLLGMPVILTNAVRNAHELEKKKAAKIIDYNEKSLAAAIISLLKNEKTLKDYRDHALLYIRQFDYATIFESNLRRILYT